MSYAKTIAAHLLGAATALALVAGLAAPALADGEKIGSNLGTLTSPFWTSYNRYTQEFAKQYNVNLLTPVNSEFDTVKQITDINNLINLGAQGIIFSPFDSQSAANILKIADGKKVPIVAIDVAPETGPIVMVVRADNRAYGDKACHYIGDHVSEGKVVQIMGDLSSLNARERREAFNECIAASYPKLKVLEVPTKNWSGEDAASGLDTLLNSNPDIKGIYMHAGGVFLAPTLQTLKRKGLLKPAGQDGHIVIVSNDGIPQEFDAIRSGEIDATVSQPADLYAKYAIFYLQKAIQGQKFAPGPTDHGSTIVEVAPGVLEDELPAPMATKENVDDKSFWANQL